MTQLPVYRASIEPDWIDYNGHLRDAYYCVVMSAAIDDVMEHLGLDAAYRAETRCTLYTVELHIHYLHEIKSTDALEVITTVLDVDRKRIYAACDFRCARLAGLAASAEVMLLHVQQGDKPAVAAFPAPILERLEGLKIDAAALAARSHPSRRIELKRR